MSEMAYDALVVEFLSKGMKLPEALKAAGAVYPDDELKPETQDQWDLLESMYSDMVPD